MKKILSILLCLTLSCIINISAKTEESFSVFVYDTFEKNTNEVSVTVSDLVSKDSNKYKILTEDGEPKIDIESEILSEAKDYENLIILDLKIDNENNPYPEIESVNVTVKCPELTGGGRIYLGKDYRLLYFGGKTSENLTSDIYDYDLNKVSFNTDRLGKFVLYTNPFVYDVTFYSEEPIYNTNNEITNPDCIYHTVKDLKNSDIVKFPTIPKKDGYIFTGWKNKTQSGLYYFASPQPHNALNPYEYFASWCSEDEYEPINIEISSNEPITKGNENGKQITLKTNYGIFTEDSDFFTEWRSTYDAETDEQKKSDILTDLKSKWNIVGCDDLIIENVTRIDDKTAEITLSGNSSDKYTDSDIYIEFDSSLLLPEPYEVNDEIIDWDDTKIKTDKDGVRAQMYRSDNAIKLSAQIIPSSGGSVSRYIVTFDFDGATEKQTVKRNLTATEPKIPEKDGYIFGGWFIDKEFTSKFDFSTKITKNTTLYAKWDKIDIKEKQIIFTIGTKTVLLFGENKENDVAPIIKNNRAFLPARFVAENLGADVEWNEINQTVTITKDDITIILTIGNDTAIVNGKSVNLEYPAFVENDRTYTPIRFVAENLGADVEYNEETQEITITKQ